MEVEVSNSMSMFGLMICCWISVTGFTTAGALLGRAQSASTRGTHIARRRPVTLDRNEGNSTVECCKQGDGHRATSPSPPRLSNLVRRQAPVGACAHEGPGGSHAHPGSPKDLRTR